MPKYFLTPTFRTAGLLIGAGLMASAAVPTARPSSRIPIRYADHQDLLYYLDETGARHVVRTVADWQRRRSHVLESMQLVMGHLPGSEKRTPLDVQVVEEARVGRLIRRKITFQSEPGARVPAYLFLPAAVSAGPLPAVLCLQQTTPRGKAEPAGLAGNPDLHYARQLADRGFVTLAPDYPSFGEHTWDFAADHGYHSGSMKAVWDNVRAVDLLQSMPEVDGRRIGVIGHSLGGHNAMFTAAFDTRLKVIVSSCGFTRFHKDDMPSWTGPRYMPRIASVYRNDADLVPFDFTEIVGTFAPRAFLACAATRDDDFDVQGVREVIAAARPVFALHGALDNLAAYYPDSGHGFPADARKVAFEFIEKHLHSREPTQSKPAPGAGACCSPQSSR